MVFLRPVVLRTQQSADSVTLDRYDAIRAQQLQLQMPGANPLPEESRPVLPNLAPAAGRTAPPGAPAIPSAAPSGR